MFVVWYWFLASGSVWIFCGFLILRLSFGFEGLLVLLAWFGGLLVWLGLWDFGWFCGGLGSWTLLFWGYVA